MSAELEVEGTHTRESIANKLEQLARDLRHGEPVTIITADEDDENLRLDPPEAPNFEMEVERDTSWTGDVKGTEVEISIEWDEDQKTDEEEALIQ